MNPDNEHMCRISAQENHAMNAMGLHRNQLQRASQHGPSNAARLFHLMDLATALKADDAGA
jgi:hypothetical protein